MQANYCVPALPVQSRYIDLQHYGILWNYDGHASAAGLGNAITALRKRHAFLWWMFDVGGWPKPG